MCVHVCVQNLHMLVQNVEHVDGEVWHRVHTKKQCRLAVLFSYYTLYDYTHSPTFLLPCRGDFLTVQKGNVCASSWMDKKVVTVMSTTSQPKTGTVLRRQKDGTRVTVPCPLSIINYNQFMGGVDRGDQVRGYYSCRTKCRKFYKYIFHFLLDVSITNAYILQKGYCSSAPFSTFKPFRLQLASELIGDFCSRRRVGRGASSLLHNSSRLCQQEGKTQKGPMSQMLQYKQEEHLHLLVLPSVPALAVPYGRATHGLFYAVACPTPTRTRSK